MRCLRSDSKHRPKTLPGIVKQVRAKSSMPEVIVKDSLRRMIQVLMFLLLSGNVSTGFPVNSYGDIVWDEVSENAPIDSAATEGSRTYWLGWLAGFGFLSYSYAGYSTCSHWLYSNIQSFNFIINVSLACRRGCTKSNYKFFQVLVLMNCTQQN